MHIVLKILLIAYGWLAMGAFRAVRMMPKYGSKPRYFGGGRIYNPPGSITDYGQYGNRKSKHTPPPPMTQAERDHIERVRELQRKGKGMKP